MISFPGEKKLLLPPNVRPTTGGSLPAIIFTDLLAFAPFASVTVNEAVYTPGLLNVTSVFAWAYVFSSPPPSSATFHSYFRTSPSLSFVPSEDNLIFAGTFPPVLLAATCTSGGLLPALYSIFTNCEFELLANHVLPYSNTYK